MRFRNVDVAGQMDLVPVAALARSPEELSARGVLFAEDTDDLDTYAFALIEIGDHQMVGLLRYRGEPPDRTTVLLRRDLPGHRRRDLLGDVLSALAFEQGDLAWVREDEAPPRSVAL